MISKGIYPYDYIDTYDKLYETKLPSIDKFYSKFSNTHCDKKDYEIAVKVWNLFNCQNLLDYHNIYLKGDVLLLADIWENFKNVCYQIYGLDASYYYTAPSLSWSAFMKFTTEYYRKKDKDFKIELITNNDMYLLFENAIRGGLSQISKRYAKSNHDGLANYDKSNPDEHI
jgi:hypothetical protein